MASGDVPEEVRPLLERLQRGPQGGLHRAALLDDHRVLRVGVPHPAPVLREIALEDLPQGAVALRAGERRRQARRSFGPRFQRGVAGGNDQLLSYLRASGGEAGEGRPDLGRLEHGVDLADGADRALGHARHRRVVRVLDDHGAARLLDGERPRAAVAERARQDDGDGVLAVGRRQRPQHRVHGRAHAVLLRAAAELQPSRGHAEVPVGRRHVDPARAERLAVGRHRDLELGLAVEDRSQQAPSVGGHVQDDADGCREICRQRAHDADQGIHATRGGTDADYASRARAVRRHVDPHPETTPVRRSPLRNRAADRPA